MDIYERLKDDHDYQRSLANKVLDSENSDEQRAQCFAAFKRELQAHAAAEEQTLYAALMAKPDGTDKARHSVAEHQDMEELLAKLDKEEIGSSEWMACCKKLVDEVLHHVDEEEEDVFPIAKELIDDVAAQQMVARFNQRKPAEAAA